MQESLASEHSSELLVDTLEEFLDGSAVTNESTRHLKTNGRNVTQGGLDTVGDPFNEVRGVLLLDSQHLVLNFLGRKTTTEDGGNGEVTTVTGVRGSHHVTGIEHLSGQFRDAHVAVLLRAEGSQGSETDHEEMETGERNHVNAKLAKITVQLTRETEGGGNTGHDGRDQLVKFTIARVGKLEGTEADIIQSFVVNAESSIAVLNQLMDRENSVVGLNNSVRDLGGGDNGVSAEHTIGVLLTDLGEQKRTETGTSTTTKRVAELETLEAVSVFGLLADDIQNGLDKFSTFGVVTLSPGVTGTRLSEDEVVGAEKLSVRASTDGVHGCRFQID